MAGNENNNNSLRKAAAPVKKYSRAFWAALFKDLFLLFLPGHFQKM